MTESESDPIPPHIPLRLRLLYTPLRLFFYLIYQPMACTYDWVAQIVSLGMWKDWVLSVMPYLDGPRVLELGHGPGHLQKSLLKSGKQTFGIDKSPQMGRLASRRLQRARLQAALINGITQYMPFPDETFHQIVATFPSEYIIDRRTLSEIYRVLTPGGKAIILPVAWITGKQLLERAAAWLFHITGQSPDWDDRALKPAIDAGFKVIVERLALEKSQLLLIQAIKPEIPDST